MHNPIHHALSLPEILSHILMWINQEKYIHSRAYYLFQCILVSKLWFHTAVRYLWTEPDQYYLYINLPEIMAAIDPPRRQFYADYIETATLCTVGIDYAEEKDGPLRDLFFPKLHTLQLKSEGRHDGGIHIPRLCNSHLRALEIDPQFDSYPDTYGPSRGEWDSMFEQIAVLFPDLEKVKIVDRARVHPGALERFADRMPRLDAVEHVGVVEMDSDLGSY
ncbi:hypothetical protein MW887_011407 [Aspergillus wentii]|nr:hypothetical protein MW887_011407 [Aspergillus wentii]